MQLPDVNKYKKKDKNAIALTNSGIQIPDVKKYYKPIELETQQGNQFDAGVLKTVADAYKSSWAYDIFDAEDMQRKASGAMPKALANKYNSSKNEHDQWLYENGLPYTSKFSTDYQKALDAASKKTMEEQAYKNKYAQLEQELYPEMYRAQQQEYENAAAEKRNPVSLGWEDLIASKLSQSKYYDLAENFVVPREEEELYGWDMVTANKKPKDANPLAFTYEDIVNEFKRRDALVRSAYDAEVNSTGPMTDKELLEYYRKQKQGLEKEIETRSAKTPGQRGEKEISIQALGASGSKVILDKEGLGLKQRLAYNENQIKQIENKQKAEAAVAPYYELMKRADFTAAKNAHTLPKNGLGEYRYINDIDGTREEWDLSSARSGSVNSFAKYNYMSAEEHDIYNYLVATDPSGERAMAYLGKLKPLLNAKEMQRTLADTERMTREAPVFANILSVPMAFTKGLGYVGAAISKATGNELDPNDPMFGTSAMQSEIRGTTADMIDSEGLKFLYQTGMSITDFAAMSPLGMAALPLMGLGAAADTTRDILQRGGTSEQALLGGALSGAAEVIFERFSLDNVIKLAKGVGFGDFAKNLLKQAGIEGSEEFFTEIANKLSDAIVMGDLSQYNQALNAYMQQGMSYADAAKNASMDAVGEVLLAGLGGMLSGGVMGGGAQAVGSMHMAGTGQTLAASDAGPGLIDTGLSMAPDTQAYRLAQSRQGRTPTNLQLGQQYYANIEAQNAEQRASLQQEMQTIGMQEKTIQTATTLFDRLTENGRVAPRDIRTLDKMRTAVQTAAETQTEVSADTRVKQVEAMAKLTPLYNAVHMAYKTGNIAAFEQAKMEYLSSFAVERTKMQAEKVKAQNKQNAANRKADITISTLSGQAEQQDMQRFAQNPVQTGMQAGNADGIINQGGGIDGILGRQGVSDHPGLQQSAAESAGSQVNGDSRQGTGEYDAQLGTQQEGPGGAGSIRAGRGTAQEGTGRVKRSLAATYKANQALQRHAETVYTATGRMPDVKIVNEVDSELAKKLDIFKNVTGRDVFLYTSDDGYANGLVDGSRVFVRINGTDPLGFTYGHEVAHADDYIYNAGLRVAKDISTEKLLQYKAYRDAQIGTPDNADVQRELIADMYGDFMQQIATGEPTWQDYGLDRETIDRFYDAFDEVMAAPELLETVKDATSLSKRAEDTAEYSRIKPVAFPSVRHKWEQVPAVNVTNQALYTSNDLATMQKEADTFVKSGLKDELISVRELDMPVILDYKQGLRKVIFQQHGSAPKQMALLRLLPQYHHILGSSKYLGRSVSGKGKSQGSEFTYLVNFVKDGENFYAIKTTLKLSPRDTVDRMHGYSIDDVDVTKINHHPRPAMPGSRSVETLSGAGDVDSISIFDLFNSVNMGPYAAVRMPQWVEAEYSRVGPGRVTIGMTEQERYEALRNGTLQVVRYDPDVLEGYPVERMNKATMREIRPILKELVGKLGVKGSYENANIALNFDYSFNTLSESAHKQAKGDFANHAKMLSLFPELAQNAVVIDAYTDKYAGTIREDANLKGVYVLLSAFQDGKSIVPVEIIVKEFTDQQNKIHLAITVKEIEAGIAPLKGAVHSVAPKGTPASNDIEAGILPLKGTVNSVAPKGTPASNTISILNLLENINTSDADLLKHIPDGFLNDAQRMAKVAAIAKDEVKLRSLRQEHSRVRFTGADGQEYSYAMPEIKQNKDGAYAVDFTVDGKRMHMESDSKEGLETWVRQLKQDNAYGHASQKVLNIRKAAELFSEGTTLRGYASQPGYSHDVGKQLRGMYLRNGMAQGGALSEQELKSLLQNITEWKNRRSLWNSFTTPQRMFEILGGWRPENMPGARQENILEGNRLKNTFFDFVMEQGADANRWMMEKADAIVRAYDGNRRTSTLAQLLGEQVITEQDASNALYDEKTMVVQTPDGVFVFDNHGQLKAMSSHGELAIFDESYLKRLRESRRKIAELTQNRDRKDTDADHYKKIREEEKRAKETLRPTRIEGNIEIIEGGNSLRATLPGGKVIADIRDGMRPQMENVTRLRDGLQEFYAAVLLEQNGVLVDNGYAPIRAIQNYFPHLGRNTHGLQDFIAVLRGDAEALPTGTAGLTSAFKPGKPFVPHMLERMGDMTEFDAIRGFDRYVQSAADLLYYTPAIQRIRQLEKYVREESGTGTQNAALASWLHNYGNTLANKKPDLDRGLEDMMGREVYTVSGALTKLFGAASVAGNLSSALSNNISLLSSIPGLQAKQVAPAMLNAFRGAAAEVLHDESNDFTRKFPSLVRRFDSYTPIRDNDFKSKAKYAGTRLMGGMFEFFDRFATETVARAKYAEMIEKGYSETEAVKRTDDFLIKMFAERSKGMTPAIFNAKLVKPVMQFQLEAWNQLSHLRDLGRQGAVEQMDEIIRRNGGVVDGIDWAAGENTLKKGGIKDIGRIAAYLALMFLWNVLTRALLGRDQAIDPIGAGVKMAKAIAEGEKVGQTALDIVQDQVPFASTFTGGRVPVMGGVDRIADFFRTLVDPDASGANKLRSGMQAATSFIPGGAQLSKTIRGIEAYQHGGSYTQSGKLQYPIVKGFGNAAKAALFGPAAFAPPDFDYRKDTLSEARTRVREELVAGGMDPLAAYQFAQQLDNGDANAGKLASIVGFDANEDGRPDFDDRNMRFIADVLGIKLPTNRSVQEQAKLEAKKYIERKRKDKDLAPEKLLAAEREYLYWIRLVGG